MLELYVMAVEGVPARVIEVLERRIARVARALDLEVGLRRRPR